MDQDPVAEARYVPALRFHWLTRFYDRVLRLTLPEERLKGLLVEQANPGEGHQVLDLGCGTATLTVMLKKAVPEATVVGLDGDPVVIRLAREKIARSGVSVEVYEGMAFSPPFEAASFDRVVSSLMFHHLSATQKELTLRSILKLLKPGGELHILDWGQAQNFAMRVAFLVVQLLDGFDTTRDNVRGALVLMMQDAGFVDVEETRRSMSIVGTLSLYRARRPDVGV